MADRTRNGRLTSEQRKQKAADARAAALTGERRRKIAFIAALGSVGAVGAAVIVVAMLVASGDQSGTVAGELSNPPAAGGTAMPPWPAPTDPAPFIASAGLNAGPMGTAQHYHAHLDVIVDGTAVPVPAQIGVVPSGAMSGLHTHDESGVLHVEAPEPNSRFTLGQLFAQWNVRLTANQIGGLTASEGNVLKVYVNGTQVSGDPAAIELAPNQQIALVYGPADATVDVPSTYAFADGG